MKPLYYFVAIFALLFCNSLDAQTNAQQRREEMERTRAQQQTGARTATRQQPQAGTRSSRQQQENDNSGLPELTVRAQDMNERMIQQIGNARWMRVIYREIDLTNEKNAPLYYPTRPVNGMMNLFSIIFQLMSEGKLKAYEYIDGYEAFDEEHLVNFKDVLDRSYIYYEETPGRQGNPPALIINESDVPSADVMAYYVKEAWYFDQNNSVYDVKTLAICPLLTEMSDLGEQRKPLFWLPYENIRPYITNSLIMTSNVNNAKTFTIDDYFRRRMFEGNIIKTENLMNKTLQEFYPQPDSLAMAQKKIDQDLTDFGKSLWFQPDTTQVEESKKSKKSVQKSSRKSSADVKGTSAATKSSSTKTPKVSAPKAEKSSPQRSVRRGKR